MSFIWLRSKVNFTAGELTCVASVSVWFRSKERPRNGILGFGRAKNETRAKKCAIFRAVSDSRSSFFAPKPHGNACYAAYWRVNRKQVWSFAYWFLVTSLNYYLSWLTLAFFLSGRIFGPCVSSLLPRRRSKHFVMRSCPTAETTGSPQNLCV